MLRTYSRKRPESQIIEGVEDLCRLCLNKPHAESENDLEKVPIFCDDTKSIYSSLTTRIMMCVGLEIIKEENLPNHICTTCYKELTRCYAFRKMCETAYQRIKMHLNAIKVKDSKLLAKSDQSNKITGKSDGVIDDYISINDVSLMVAEDNQIKGEITDKECNRTVTGYIADDGNDEKPLMQSHNPLSPNTENDLSPEPIPPLKSMPPPESIPPPEIPHSNSLLLPLTFPPPTLTIPIEPLPAPPPKDTLSFYIVRKLLERRLLEKDGEKLVVSEDVGHLQLITSDGALVTMVIQEDDEEDADEATMQQEVVNNKDPLKNSQIMKNDDDNSRSTVCRICNKTLSTRSVLRRHMRVHSGERPFQCKECGARFAQREVLIRHEKVHLPERPFRCSLCEKSFTQRNGLLVHFRSHNPVATRGVTLHRCQQCDRCFLYASGLSRHMKVHNGDTYPCIHCNRPFRDKSSLARHLKMHCKKRKVEEVELT